MPSSWFGSKSSRQTRPQPVLEIHTESDTAPNDSQPGVKRSQSHSTFEPAFSSQSVIPPPVVHAHINDPSAYKAGNLHHPITIPLDAKERIDIHDESSEALDDPYTRVDPAQAKRNKGKARENEGLFTPQDAVLADVFGFTLPDIPAPGQTRSLEDSDTLPRSSVPAGGSAIPPSLPIYDPFTGGRIGEHASAVPSAGATANTTSTALTDPQAQQQTTLQSLPTAGDTDLWTRLARILELQGEVARMHAEMEGVGNPVRSGAAGASGGGYTMGTNPGATSDTRSPTAKVSNPRRKVRGETIPVGDDDDPPAPGAGEMGGGNITDTTSDSEDEDDASVFAKRRRDEEFAKLADQFAERKVAIARIMNKLDDLSDALKAFHALQTPVMDLGSTGASRMDTFSSVASDATRTSLSSPPPQYTGFPRPTLEPPHIPQPHGKIVIDAQHVDSPVDMNPAQSVFGMGE
ncbi:hypothetical protein F5J12DRAFT_781412 [Pisolithus orientalis]|uniref:uncharacterized protein n=1 Tax=Pisolithus orientalis TaxID=936130 RepID=UPI0022241CA9|nr:uncharacterized protein F5J12DRAFT_781412 [Pisolithus orientalis]KAI6012466.1 hypothetical protein F5J12DRAFT_781412 [Pisolithus orientalis]